MQTILYVFGPFIAEVLAGGGVIWAASAWIRRVVVPRAQLNGKRLRDARKLADQIEADARHYNRSDAATAELVLAIENNELLRDQMPDALLAKLYALTEDRPRQLPEGGRP